jgi:hypothetical protein
MDRMAEAIHLLRENDFEDAAAILGKHWAEAIRSKRKPRKRSVKVRLTNGRGFAWIDKERFDEATECYD